MQKQSANSLAQHLRELWCYIQTRHAYFKTNTVREQQLITADGVAEHVITTQMSQCVYCGRKTWVEA